MIRKFVDRKMELEALESAYQKGVKLFVVYGRRRVGKTTLLRKFLENKRGFTSCALREVMKRILRGFLRRLANCSTCP